MAFELTRDLTVNGDAALEVIKAKVGVWRESEIPVSLRDRSVFGTEVRIEAQGFRVMAFTNRRGSWARAVGSFAERPDGVTTMTVRIGCPSVKSPRS
ncbi:MAG: hypothetical protein IT355_15310 [Gemmatimonadaceae bacterium]|nr:hypothetical protein [Gemmatimonadaceae bacterium]